MGENESDIHSPISNFQRYRIRNIPKAFKYKSHSFSKLKTTFFTLGTKKFFFLGENEEYIHSSEFFCKKYVKIRVEKKILNRRSENVF